MRRFAWLLLILAAFVDAGCSRKDPLLDVAKVEALPVLTPKSGGEMVLIPAGTFTMGGGAADEALHTASVAAFYLDKATVTQELFAKIMGINPSKLKDPKLPVERTKWTDAARFCNKCSEVDGLIPCYNLDTWECDFAADGYRLPTETEWEYACRAGSTGKFCCGDSDKELLRYAWFKPNSQGHPHPVGLKLPNRWGLFDMHGNVWQWCNDWYGENPAAQSPHGPATGKMRVLRGGDWESTADKCRSASRHKEFPVYSDACFGSDSYGFRRARNGAPSDKTVVVAVSPKATTTLVKQVEPPAVTIKPAPGPAKIDVNLLKGTIVFAGDHGDGMQIWRMHASGKDLKQLTRGKEPSADPRFAPDGKRILYATKRAGSREVWLMDRDGGNAKFVTKGSQGSWAPDGKSILFIEDNQTFVRDLATGKERLVTPKTWARCGVPAFSPDGQRFAVASRHLGVTGIFILNLDGQEIVPLKSDEACCTPYWSKDGKSILCQTEKGHIHQIGIDGKSADQITYGADFQHDARYSPDESMVLFCRAPTAEGPWQICVQKLDGGEDEFVPLTKEGSNVQPDWHAAE